MATFPVEVQRNRVLGWPPFDGGVFPGLEAASCAVYERYTTAGATLPVLTFGSTTSTSSPTAWAAITVLVGANGTTAELSNFLQQLHTAVLGLANLYVRPNFTPWSSANLQALGVKTSGAQWPQDLDPLLDALKVLQFRVVSPLRTVPFEFDFAGFATTDNEPYAGWAAQFTKDGKQVVGWRVNASSTSKYGAFSMRYANDLTTHVPARLLITPEGRAKGATFGYLPCFGDPLYEAADEDSGADTTVLKSVVVEKHTWARYFIGGSLVGAPWFNSEVWELNTVVLPPGGSELFEVTDLVVNGTNLFKITRSGAYAWSDLYLLEMAFLRDTTYPPPTILADGRCYNLHSIMDPDTGDLRPYEVGWTDEGSMLMDGVVQEPFTCLAEPLDVVERPHVIAAASVVSPGMLVKCEISPPPGVGSYQVHLIDALADIDPLVPVFANVASGTATYPITQFEFVVPGSPTWTYYIAVVFHPETDPARTNIAAVADVGYGNRSSTNGVEALIKGRGVTDIILAGDVNYTLGHASTIDSNVGRHWRKFIFPYLGSFPLKSGETDAISNHCWPCPGNHDWGNPGSNTSHPTALQPYLNYFPVPRYYKRTFGDNLVDIWFLDSDINEPDGRRVGSAQYYWFLESVQQSTALYKGVVFHHPPYTSGSGHGPNQDMRWDFSAHGVQFAINGHNHNYERYERPNDMVYFVVGTGGPELDGFIPGGQISANSKFRLETNGAMFIEANVHSIRFTFRDNTGTVRDSKELWATGSPPPDATVLTTILQVVNPTFQWPCYYLSDNADPIGGDII